MSQLAKNQNTGAEKTPPEKQPFRDQTSTKEIIPEKNLKKYSSGSTSFHTVPPENFLYWP